MIQAILLDADGIVIKKRERFFSGRFAEKQGVPITEVLPFFKNEMRQAFVNKIDIKDGLAPYLPKWKWKGSADDFLAYWFGEESPRDEEVIRYTDALRAKGVKCYVATDREKYWSAYLQNEVGLKERFDGFFFSYDIGYEKHVPEYFQKVLKRLNLTADEVLFWDDDQKNVGVARSVGLHAEFYDSFEEFKNKLEQYLAHNV